MKAKIIGIQVLSKSEIKRKTGNSHDNFKLE